MQVMIDQYADGRRVGRYRVGYPVEPVDLVEVHAEDHVGLADEAGHRAVVILLEYSDVSDVSHPFEEIRVAVRRDATCRVPQPLQIRAPGQRGSDRVSVGIRMRQQSDLLGRSAYDLSQQIQFLFGYAHP